MKELIEVFRMTEIAPKLRASIIIRLGQAINDQYGMNLTEALVYELVAILDPDNSILTDEYFVSSYVKSGGEKIKSASGDGDQHVS